METNSVLRKSLPFFLLGFALLGFAVYTPHSMAETCTAGPVTATINWDKATIDSSCTTPGCKDATETWAITGADSASGGCVDGGDINSFVSNLSLGPQSYTFKNIQKSIACTVTAYVAGKEVCSASDAVVVSTAPPPPPPASGGERCWFDLPGQGGYLFMAQDSNYTAGVNGDICWDVQSGDDRIPGASCAGDLHWTSVSGSAWNAPALSDSDYTATFNGGSFHNKTTPDIKISDGVRLTRSELLQNNIYSITIKKKSDGSTAATCSVTIAASIPTGPAQGAVQPGKFPDPGTYSINTAAGPASAAFKYAPQIPGVFVPMTGMPAPSWFSDNGLGTFLGQFQKALYYVIGHEPGAYGAWDLSDPMNPASPSLQFIANNNGGNGPVQHLWPHASHGVGAATAENGDGEARMIDKNGLAEYYGNSYVCGSDPVYGYPLICHYTPSNGPTGISFHSFSGGQASFGQQAAVNSNTPLAVFATDEGNFFGYSSGGNKIYIFDMTGPSGSANPPYLEPAGAISWNGVTDMHVTSIPGRSTQFMIAKLRPANTTTWKIGELSSETGKILNTRQKTVTFNVSESAQSYTGDSNLLSATIQNSTYIFLVEKVKPINMSGSYNIPSIGDITIGAYKLNPADLTVTRKGSITVKSAGLSAISTNGYFTIISAASNSAYPFIAVPRSKKSGTIVVGDGVDLYSVQDLVTSGGDSTPQPALSLPGITQWPVQVGGIVVNEWPLNGFLKTEGNKVNLYLYRNAFYYNGKANTTNGISMTWTDQYSNYGPLTSPSDEWWSWGNPTVRVDRVDVTALTGSYTPPGGGGSTGGGGGTGGGGNPPTGGGGTPIGAGGECYARYPNDAALRNLCEQIAALKKQACGLNPNLSICK